MASLNTNTVKNKYAFILENSAYSDFGRLKNATNDVDVIAEKLENLDFEVKLYRNLTYHNIYDTFYEFTKTIKDSGGVDTVVIYYAGHGFQENGKNYILTIPDDTGEIGGFSILNMVASLERISARRLLFFDACRGNFDAEAVEASLAKTRSGQNIGDRPRISVGLTDARADYGSEFVLSFSASPGKKAYDEMDNGSDLSPYASALAKYIDDIDLPLSYILGRVSEDVRHATKNRQEPWAVFTTSKPFYFNPSPLLFFLGNLMAFIAFFMALGMMFVSILAALEANKEAVPVSFGLLALSLIAVLLAFGALLYGLARAFNRARGSRLDEDPTGVETTATPLHGALGGLLGGIISAPIIAGSYWWNWRTSLQDVRLHDGECMLRYWLDPSMPIGCPKLPALLVEITVSGIFVATVLGLLAVIFSNRRRRKDGWIKSLGEHGRIIAGAVSGGSLAGLLVGPPVTAYFGSLDRPFLDPGLLMYSAVACVAIIAFSIVNYSLDRFTKARLMRSFFAAGGATVIAGTALGIALYVLYGSGFIETTFDWANSGFNDETRPTLLRYGYLLAAGVPYGVVFGTFLGFLIGITRVLSEPWEGLKLWDRPKADL